MTIILKKADEHVARLMRRLPALAVSAHHFAEAMNVEGVLCYVRCWHLGQTGWFVVNAETYARMNFPHNPETFAAVAKNNRNVLMQLQADGQGSGCFFCTRTWPAEQEYEFDESGAALCPNCDIDSIAPGVLDPVSLAEGMGRWWKPTGPDSTSLPETTATG